MSLPAVSLADYFGLEVIDRSDLTICQDQSDPDIPFKLHVCEVFVVFDDPADLLISVAFSNVSTTDPAGFYQHTFGGDTAPGCNLLTAIPTLVCDSFVTLGEECAVGGSSTDPDFDSTAFNTSGTASGGWFNTAPANGQGAPDANGRVMIARFSYKQNKTTSGDVCVFTKLAGSEDITEFLIEPFDCADPGMQTGAGGCPTGTVWYVDDTATGTPTGMNWADAFTDLQTALNSVSSGDEIWVAEGTYKPTKRTDPLVARTETFALASCLKIYGGYLNGGGTRDPETYTTILSGDIGSPGIDFDNCFHVVSAGSDSSSVDETAILDGFTVTKGFANVTDIGAPNGTDKGSAVNIWLNSTPSLENCTFYFNYSLDHGAVNDHGGVTLSNCVFDYNHGHALAGGLYVHLNIGTTVTNCDFRDNWSHGQGGGAYVKTTTTGPEPVFTNCNFSGNEALHGGGFYSGVGRSPSLVNCTFSANTVTGVDPKGAAIYADEGSLTVTDCTFSGNSTASGGLGGAIYIHDGSAPFIEGCAFSGNSVPTGDKGGAIYVKGGADPLIENCTFTNNDGGGCGGALYLGAFSTPKIRDCKFIGNGAALPELIYGGAIYSQGATAEVVNCVFQDGASRYGGAIYQTEDPEVAEDVPSMDLINCIFVNNKTSALGPTGGGAIWGESMGSFELTNCLFVGNHVDRGFGGARGGAVGVTASMQLTATNCTFVANSAVDDGGGIYVGAFPASNTLDNCVFWDNTDNSGANNDESAQIYFDVTAPAVTYSDFMNLVQPGDFCLDEFGSPPCEGNIDALPQFVAAVNGIWTADGVYCSQACADNPACNDCDGLEVGQSKFTDTGATYAGNEHVGKLLNADTTQDRVALIAANTSTTITVWGDLTGVGAQSDPYQIDDYRLHSPGSPCIDAADNNAVTICSDDLDGNERFFDDPLVLDTGLGSPEHPLDFVDMGAYESGSPVAPDCNENGTPDECDIDSGSSLDCDGLGAPDECCPADFNGDQNVDPIDLVTLLATWGTCSSCTPGVPACGCQPDLNNDCMVGPIDLATLLGAWGSCQ